MEKHGVVVHMLQEVLTCRLTFSTELDLPVLIVEIQQGVQLMVAEVPVLIWGGVLLLVVRGEYF